MPPGAAPVRSGSLLVEARRDCPVYPEPSVSTKARGRASSTHACTRNSCPGWAMTRAARRPGNVGDIRPDIRSCAALMVSDRVYQGPLVFQRPRSGGVFGEPLEGARVAVDWAQRA